MNDLISRRAAIDAAEKLLVGVKGIEEQAITENNVNYICAEIAKLPTAQPMQKKGEWIERSVFDEPQGKRIEQWQSAKCSVCGKYHTTPYLYYFDWFNYCPSCGADMRRKTDA